MGNLLHGQPQTTSTRSVAIWPTWRMRCVRQPVRDLGSSGYRLLRVLCWRVHPPRFLAIFAVPGLQRHEPVLRRLWRSRLPCDTARRHRHERVRTRMGVSGRTLQRFRRGIACTDCRPETLGRSSARDAPTVRAGLRVRGRSGRRECFCVAGRYSIPLPSCSEIPTPFRSMPWGTLPESIAAQGFRAWALVSLCRTRSLNGR